jgi:tRNA (guanine37-N1)-methyltransferase
MFLCGRYEGYDERIRTGFAWEEISLGDFVLAGGELAALVVLEAAVRLIPGVLGCAQSAELESFEGELLDYPQYTRPREFRGDKVPDVLMSGDHKAVARWRLEQARLLTARKRAAASPLSSPLESPLESPDRASEREPF